jgi:DNA-binding CsgD family transcriptional regulator
MRIGAYETHPAADVFPLLSDVELTSLVQDIAEHGLRIPIVLHEGRILDGRNRMRACLLARVEPMTAEFQGSDPVAYVVSLNLHRRHLDASQRAMVGGRIATLSDGTRQVGKFADVPTQAQAAELLNVSERLVRDARKVLESGDKALIKAVDKGEVAVSSAANKVKGKTEPAPWESGLRAMREAQAPKTAELDARVKAAMSEGRTQREVARMLGVPSSTVSVSLRRQGVTRRAPPIQSVGKRAAEMSEDLTSATGMPEFYLEGAEKADLDQAMESLRALQSAVGKTLNWLKKEANKGE